MNNPMLKNLFRYEFGGLPILPTLAGSFILMSTIFMWYGGFFVDRFQPLMGIVEEDVSAAALGVWYPIGMAISMAQGVGIALLLKWRGWPKLPGAVGTAAAMALFLGVTVFGYRLVILPEHSVELFLINASGLITAWSLAAIVTTLLRPHHRPADHAINHRELPWVA